MSNKYLSTIITYSGLMVGTVALSLFAAFLFVGSFSLFDFGLSETAGLLLNAGLCLIFFVQHSVMIRKSLRDNWKRIVPKPYFGAFYAVASGVLLLFLLVFWQKSDMVVLSASGVSRWGFRFLFFVSILGFVWSIRSLGSFDPFGAKTIKIHLKSSSPKTMPLAIRGPYRLVRHPLYFFSLLMIWPCPDVSADRMYFNGLWTLWIIIGTILEERDLVREFGESYRQYQRNVPMLLPWKMII